MLLVTANDIVAIQKVDWKPGDSDEEQRARKLYASLGEQLSAAGFLPYRLGVQSQAAVEYPEQRSQLLQRLKKAFDPAGVISPGRYGLR